MQPEQRAKTGAKVQLTLKNISQPSQYIHLDLNKWALLCSSGAHWIFTTREPGKQSEHSSHHSEPNYNYRYQSGMYVMRMKKNKRLETILKARVLDWIPNLDKSKQGQLKISKKGKLKSSKQGYSVGQQIKEPAKWSLQKDLKPKLIKVKKHSNPIPDNAIHENSLNQLISIIYTKFLSEVVCDQPSSSALLPLISQTIVRPSDKYIVEQIFPKTKKTENETASKKGIDLFVEFIVRQVMCFQLLKMRGISQLQFQTSGQKEQQARRMLDRELARQPFDINEEILSKCKLDTLAVSFQLNELVCQQNDQCPKEEHQSPSKALNKQGKSAQARILFEVFQFKPKTILPDVYTQEFIDYYIGNIWGESQLDSCVHQKINQQNGPCNITSNLQSSLKAMIQESFFSGNGVSSSKGYFNIESTRWFKKNCRSQNRNHHNPLCYFATCLVDSQTYISQSLSPINFRSKNHLKLQQIINHQQPFNNSLLKAIPPSQLHSIVIERISKRPINSRIHSSVIVSQSIRQSQEGLSLIEEILALQMIDLVHDKYYDVLQIHQIVADLRNCLSFGWQSDSKATAHIQTNIQRMSCYIVEKPHTNTYNQIPQSISSQNQTKNQESDLPQHLYPSNVLSVISSLFRLEVYQKSKILSEKFQTLIFTDPSIQSSIRNSFKLNLDSHHQKSQTILYIKQSLYKVMRFLISLTWKDVSVMVQALTRLGQDETQYQNYDSFQRVKSDHFVKTEVAKCGIIDFGIKTTQNIFKNLQKQEEFLSNYQNFVRERQINKQTLHLNSQQKQ